MNKIYIPSKGADDWKSLLADPDKQWRTRYSAKTLACCWEESIGFPDCVSSVFDNSEIDLFKEIEILFAVPEYKVDLLGGSRASQNDIFVLARSNNNQLISIMVEGKVNEPFGDRVADWKKNESKGKRTRLKFLYEELGLENCNVDNIRYQLLHRTASALIVAKKFNAENALMLVHTFAEPENQPFKKSFEDYRQFLSLFSLQEVRPNSLVFTKKVGCIKLFLAWANGNRKYLKR